MNNKQIEKLIKECLKDIALRIYDLNYKDRASLLAEHKEWIFEEITIENLMMLPYEAYTEEYDNQTLDE